MKCPECNKESNQAMWYRKNAICLDCYYKKDVMERIESRLRGIEVAIFDHD